VYSWQSIPIFIINRNRLQALQSLINWATHVGCRDIRVIDSNSDYPPLLTFYSSLPSNISLLRLPTNAGPWAFWQSGIHKTINSRYIITDSDLVPSEFCPDDLIPRLVDHCGKVGPGLRIDNLPKHYGQAVIAYRWEAQFWHRPLGRGMFSAPIDTTFALYPQASEFNRSTANIRLGHPYLFDHTPWYVDDKALDDEEAHYRRHTDQSFSNWSTNQAESRIAKKKFVRDFENRRKILHISDGTEIPGWINMRLGGTASDTSFTAERWQAKIPLENDTVDGFYALDLFERIPNPFALMVELYRVAKIGATLHARLRLGRNLDAMLMLGIRSLFQCFSQPAVWRGRFDYSADWRVEKVTAITDKALDSAEISATQLATLAATNVAREVIVELSAVKPSRPRFWGSPGQDVRARATSDDRCVPSFCR
jgi:hypothetical protein